MPACAQAVAGPQVQRDVFVVGRETAIGDPLIGFKPTRVEFTQEPMDLAGKRELVRMLLMEQGFAHRALPLGAPGLVLHANGKLTVGSKELQTLLYKGGMCAGAGDRIMVTDIVILGDRINIDINGGPYLPHRFLRHISINNMPLAGDGQVGELPTGTRITLLFEGQTPRVSASELKALLEPLLDFGLKSSEQAFADTLPDPIKKAVEEHEVLVGMNRRMVLAALGQPESKLRERATESSDGEVFEEWIYGHTPQTIRFVRFRGDRVVLMKTAALGKPIEVRDKDQMAGYRDPALIHEVSLGDTPGATKGTADAEAAQPKAPSLRAPGERPDSENSKPAAPDPTVKKSFAANNLPNLM
ncbi:hypothetical protein Terro_1944 [Terriglobus roseus DSM 18391]|uniref:Uncharacterized protein n=1 Tax=Terriglobus roseus (strain DSM 18391 / NRRL B-41598 / KBS 63) TaxID=926566 RepID=I3ZG62_TERRK|nr:hypothetical protein [Terriglobus roseus]AFL88230.1 hypothetical protein Terro_1944 [Terriglobus roseus DSM 18391]